jgi:hypothetical protein
MPDVPLTMQFGQLTTPAIQTLLVDGGINLVGAILVLIAGWLLAT